MNIFFVIASILTVALAQQTFLNCNYTYNGETYGCDLIINNLDGLNNFTEIGGNHLQGFTNADVERINRIGGVSTNVPRIICETFSNLVWIELHDTGLTEIDDNAFGGCALVTEISLYANRIRSISANAFVHLTDISHINLATNLLATLPENIFSSQQNLMMLSIGHNPFVDIPAGLFRPLGNLQVLDISNGNLNEINNEWFTNNARLYELYLSENRITLSADGFVGLDELKIINLAYNGINEIQSGMFAGLPNLEHLLLYGNDLTELEGDSFPHLGHLIQLDLSRNPISVIHGGAFRGFVNLTSLTVSYCSLRQLYSNSFEGLQNLLIIDLNYNDIEELPTGVFMPMPNVNYIGLWNNRLKSLHRHSFGSLDTLHTLDLEHNAVNAIDEAIIDDALVLTTLVLNGNLCANSFFGNFQLSKVQFLPMLERCFRNMRFIVDTTTEHDEEFSFFAASHSGIALRVNADSEVQIALTPFNFIWNPSIEILIGTTNNTRSVIRLNQETNVVTVPTPYIIMPDQWNDFRVTWEHQVVLVYRGNNSYPFMAFTMQDLFPVNFYGLKSIETSATWTVQPFEW